MLTDGVIFRLMAAVIGVEETLFVVKQVPPVMDSVQVTISPLERADVLYTGEFPDCTLLPFTLKSKFTVPPPVFAAVAVNMSWLPAQTGPAGNTARLMVGVIKGITVTVMEFELTVLEVKQPPLMMIVQEILSPLFKVEQV